MCSCSIHQLRSLYSVSSEVVERQQQCPGFTQKRFAANELIHHKKCAGDKGDDDEDEKEEEKSKEEDEEGQWGGARAEQREGLLRQKACNMSAVAFSCPLTSCLVLNVADLT